MDITGESKLCSHAHPDQQLAEPHPVVAPLLDAAAMWDRIVREFPRIGAYLSIENPLIGICVTQNCRIVFCNVQFTRITRFSNRELCGRHISELFPCKGWPYKKSALPGEVNRGAPHTREVAGVTKDGCALHARQSVYGFQHKGKRVAIWQVTDISEQKAAQARLRETEKRLRFLSGQVLGAQEAERKRVASELHDGIGQSLSSIKLGLENTIKDLCDSLPEQALGKLSGAVIRIRGTIDEVRRISMDLRPAMLDDLGIEPTINWLCREVQLTDPSLRIIRRIHIQHIDVSNTSRVVIFRILQEALNNVIKHAAATVVQISLKARRSGVTLTVKDNGRGFIADGDGDAGGGFGLYSMRERATLSGGRFEVRSVPGAGTTVAVSWPYDAVFGRDWNETMWGRRASDYSAPAAT